MADNSIRPRHAEDLPGIIQAMKDVYRTDGYPVEGMDEPGAFVSPPGMLHAWVATHEDSIVGHIAVIAGSHGDEDVMEAWSNVGGITDKTVVVARLFVCESSRRLGLANRLVSATVQWARDIDKKVVMNVLTRNVDAMKLYQKQGFQQFGKGVHVTPEGEEYDQLFYVSP